MNLFNKKKGEPDRKNPVFPLGLAADGEAVRIASIRGKGEEQLKLISRSINIGDVIEVVRRKSNGSLVIKKGESRYVLGGRLAMSVDVIPNR